MDKNNAIVLIRTLAMLSIIVCHIFQELNNELAYWFNVGVQIFVFTSGFLYGAKNIKNIKEFYIKRVKRILIPYYVFLVVVFIYYYIFKSEFINLKLVISTLLGLQLFGTSISGLGHLWFVTLIIICYVITPLLEKCYKKLSKYNDLKFWFVLSIILIIFQGVAFIPGMNFNITINISVYILGYAISKKYYTNHLDSTNKSLKLGLGALSIGIILSIIKIISYMDITIYIKKLFSLVGVYKNVFIGIAIFLLIYMFWEKNKEFIKNKKILNILYFLDKYSYCIYITHLIFILGPSSLLNLTNNLFLNLVLIFICIIVSAIVLNKITEKINAFLEKRKL